MSVFESELTSYMIENMIFTKKKYMSDVGKFAKKKIASFNHIGQGYLG